MKKFVLFIIMSFVITSVLHSMNIHVFGEHMFTKQVVHTEYKTYQLLKENPLDVDVNYLAVPWGWIINKNKLNVVPSDLRLNGGFTVCQHIKYEKIIPLLKKIGIDVLFTPHVVSAKMYDGITVLPYPHFQKNTAKPVAKKDIRYSFIGIEWSHSVRAKIFAMDHPKDTYIVKRKKWHYWDKPKNIEHDANEYKDVLARSRFALCPRGTGASTIRFWEALGAGAIPVLISDEMILPEGIDWSTAIIKVAECDVEKIPDILQEITPEIEQAMRESCLHIHEQFSGENFVSMIRDYYKV